MLQPYNVRRVRASDLDRILEVEHACFGKDAYDRKLFAGFLDKPAALFLAAEHGGRLCGYIVASIGAQRAAGRAEIVSVAVDPAARRQGAASLLMDTTLRRLRRRGVGRVVLTVRLTNREARAFYEKHGFDKVRIVRNYYEEGADGLRMAKALR